MSIAGTDFDFVRTLVAKRSGNILRPGQNHLIESRLTPLAVERGLDTVQDLVAELKRSSSPKLVDAVAEAVTINETSFFRDPHVFNSLKKVIIPSLVKANAATRSIRIWCAACSSGQEPYTIAMVLQESFPELSNWRIQIVATDYCEEVLGRAESGEFSQLEVNRGLPVKTLIRFFERKGAVWKAKPELRKLIQFRHINLLEPFSPTPPFDVVFIRNVLIYFDQPTKQDILTRIKPRLRPDGYLFIGAAETLIGLGVPYVRKEIDATVCYRPDGK